MTFESGVLPEPLLIFGGQQQHVDPKAGLSLYGPYSPADEPLQSGKTIVVGMVGPAAVVADATRFLAACTGALSNHSGSPFQSPGFPGFNESTTFRSALRTGNTWNIPFRQIELERALSTPAGSGRVQAVSGLYVEAVGLLAERVPPPDVVLCCISGDVYTKCLVGASMKTRERLGMRRAASRRSDAQLKLFGGEEGETDELAFLDLWKAIKAGAMQYAIPTQLILERSLSLNDDVPGPQDIATRAWNLGVGLYHKAGGSPWRLANVDPGVCFVGVSFFRDARSPNGLIHTSVAQAFTASGDGYVLRGSPFESKFGREDRTPHMDRQSASSLVHDVIEQYKRQHRGQAPARLVVHKSSLYWDEEREGMREGARDIASMDLVSFRSRGIQLYREGNYPPLRGTYVKFDARNLLLYAKGYIPYFGTYPGARSPQPIEIAEHIGDSPWDTVLTEILALTKMNWNSADFSAGEPITMSFSRKVGALLSEIPPDAQIRPEYRYYM
jgi:hypothetical protein